MLKGAFPMNFADFDFAAILQELLATVMESFQSLGGNDPVISHIFGLVTEWFSTLFAK
jgi:hypothetical protein